MFSYFMRARLVLQDLPHVYVVDPDEDGVTALPFYNPNIRRNAEQIALLRGPAASLGAEPYWLFVLTSDYKNQIKPDGADAVHARVARKLQETMTEGRRAVLMAPAACVAALEKEATLKECCFIQNCDYDRFMALLLGAEYAFYWNIFSASVIARLLNRLPTFFFAAGHIADENQIMFDKGMSRYYRNARPTYLPREDRLTTASLSGLALAQEEQLFRPFLENVQHLPTPDVLVRNLLAQR